MPTGRTSDFPNSLSVPRDTRGFVPLWEISRGEIDRGPSVTATASRCATPLPNPTDPECGRDIGSGYRAGCHIGASTVTHRPTCPAPTTSAMVLRQTTADQHRPRGALFVLNGFSLSVDNRNVGPLPRKARALLAYLAIRNGRPVFRETMSDLLWTGRGVEQARHSLRQALLVLRQALRDASAGLVRGRDGTLALSLDVIDTDFAHFRTLAGSSDPVDLEAAAALIIGRLMGSFAPVAADFDDWPEQARQDIMDDLLELLERLFSAYMTTDNNQQTARIAERMFAIDPLREDIHRQLMRAYVAAGRRGEALHLHAKATEILLRELGVSPAAETETVAAGLRGIAVPDIPHLQSEPQFRSPGSRLTSIMVLPYEVIGHPDCNDQSGTGLATDIVCRLARVRALMVKPLGSNAGGPVPRFALWQADASNGVHYVVRGSIRRHGDQVRVTSELVDMSSNQVICARIDDAIETLSFADQDRVAAQIVNALMSITGTARPATSA